MGASGHRKLFGLGLQVELEILGYPKPWGSTMRLYEEGFSVQGRLMANGPRFLNFESRGCGEDISHESTGGGPE